MLTVCNGCFPMTHRVNGAVVFSRGGSMVPMDLLNGRLSAQAHARVVMSAASSLRPVIPRAVPTKRALKRHF